MYRKAKHHPIRSWHLPCEQNKLMYNYPGLKWINQIRWVWVMIPFEKLFICFALRRPLMQMDCMFIAHFIGAPLTSSVNKCNALHRCLDGVSHASFTKMKNSNKLMQICGQFARIWILWRRIYLLRHKHPIFLGLNFDRDSKPNFQTQNHLIIIFLIATLHFRYIWSENKTKKMLQFFHAR